MNRNKKNLMEKIDCAIGSINPYYDATCQDIRTIVENSFDKASAVCHAFVYGYMQGVKATRAEMRGDTR